MNKQKQKANLICDLLFLICFCEPGPISLRGLRVQFIFYQEIIINTFNDKFKEQIEPFTMETQHTAKMFPFANVKTPFPCILSSAQSPLQTFPFEKASKNSIPIHFANGKVYNGNNADGKMDVNGVFTFLDGDSELKEYAHGFQKRMRKQKKQKHLLKFEINFLNSQSQQTAC